MLVLRLNASQDGLRLHNDPPSMQCQMRDWMQDTSPVIVLIHGYKWQPKAASHCPHEGVYADTAGWGRSTSWLNALSRAGLPQTRILALGWDARGSFQSAYQQADATGRQLAGFLDRLGESRVHILAHSLGARVALSTLEAAERAQLDRVVMMTPAIRPAQLARAQHCPRGREARLIRIASRENDVFDRLFDWVAPHEPAPALPQRQPKTPQTPQPPTQNSHAGCVTQIRLDCPESLERLRRMGYDIAARQNRICHWSSYLRPGIFGLYAALLHPYRPLSTSYIRRMLPQSETALAPELSFGTIGRMISQKAQAHATIAH